MSCFTVQVLEPSSKILEIETCAGESVSSISIENIGSPNIALSQCIADFPADFNDRVIDAIDDKLIASSGVNISSQSGNLYFSSIINASSGISLSHSSGIYTIRTANDLYCESLQFSDNTTQVTAYQQTYRNINSSASLFTTDDIIFVDCSISNVFISLPSALNIGGKKIHVKRKSGPFNLTIVPSGSETIDDANSFSVHHNYQAITLVSDNTNWFII